MKYSLGKRARELVKQTLAFAQQSNEDIKPIQIDGMAKEVIKFIRSTISTTIKIKQMINSESLIAGNPTLVRQIFFKPADQCSKQHGRRGRCSG